ncbi:MAG TPA: nuclear transport factor 2 family protein [Solirubrobacteraceae bacterium]|jgi:ketosteroid isomerase-like protein
MPEESTSPDLVEAVTRHFEEAERGDFDAVFTAYAADCIWESEDGMTHAVGVSQVRGFWERYATMFEDRTLKVEPVVDLGNGVVYAVCHGQGRLPGDKGLRTARAAYVFVWLDGMITRVIAFQDPDEARAAAERLAEEQG